MFGKRLLICILYLLAHPCFAEDIHKLNAAYEKLGTQQQELYKTLADELRCPTCIGLSVLQSDAPFSVQIKTALVEQIELGKNQTQILDFFKERFGLWILRTPPKEGFHWFAWYLPIGLIILGALLVWGVFWRRRYHPQSEGIRTTEKLLKQMDHDLNALRKKQ